MSHLKGSILMRTKQSEAIGQSRVFSRHPPIIAFLSLLASIILLVIVTQGNQALAQQVADARPDGGQGGTWSPLGVGLNQFANTVAVSGNNVYAGGVFDAAGGQPASRIAKWDGSSWSALGTGLDENGQVYSIAISGTDVYVGGQFPTAGGITVNNIARWDGSSWHALGTGVGSTVHTVIVSGGNVYVGGDFTTAGGQPANYVARWNGSTWSPLGTGTNIGSSVYAIAASGNDLYVGGTIYMAGGVIVNNIARWNGSTWSALGTGTNNSVFAVAVNGGNVYAAGRFSTAGGATVNNIARWNGSTWSALGTGTNRNVYALAVHGSDIYAGGVFTTTSGQPANRIAHWDGAAWSALGSGLDDVVNGIAINTGAGILYTGGIFLNAGGVPASRIASYLIPAPGPTSTPMLATATSTSTSTSTATSTPTNTQVPLASNTPTRRPTNTPAPTYTSGPTNPPTSTPTPGGPSPTPCAIQFTDVHPGDYFYEGVTYLYCHGVINGYTDQVRCPGTGVPCFRPGDSTTRAQLVKFIALAENWVLVNPTVGHFTDVQPGHTFYSYVETAVDRQAISGYTDPARCPETGAPCFRPGDNVTRGQVCKIISVAARWFLIDPVSPHFTDVGVDHVFYVFIETAYSHGIINGYTDPARCTETGAPCFRSVDNATRGQIAKIVYNAITQP